MNQKAIDKIDIKHIGTYTTSRDMIIVQVHIGIKA